MKKYNSNKMPQSETVLIYWIQMRWKKKKFNKLLVSKNNISFVNYGLPYLWTDIIRKLRKLHYYNFIPTLLHIKNYGHILSIKNYIVDKFFLSSQLYWHTILRSIWKNSLYNRPSLYENFSLCVGQFQF